MENKIQNCLIVLIISILIFFKWNIYSYLAFLGIIVFFVMSTKSSDSKFFLLGILLLLPYIIISHNVYNYEIGQEVVISGEVTRANERYENYQRIEVTTKDKGKFSIATRGDVEFKKYDLVSGTIEIEDVGGNYNFNLLNREHYFFIKNINSSAVAFDLNKNDNPSLIKNLKSKFIYDVISSVDKYFSLENRGIVKKLILADGNNIDDDIEGIYQEGGLAHLLAISGLHIFIIIGVLEFLFIKMGIKYNIRFTIVFFILTLYGFILDYPPSVSRAMLMFFIREISSIYKVKITSTSVIYIACIILLTVYPKWLYDLGFQLSFISVIGISIFYKKLGVNKDNLLLNSLALYVSVSILLFPLLAYYFNNFNPFSLVANIFMTPIISFVLVGIYLGLIMENFFSIGGILLKIVDFILEGSNFYLEQIVSFSDFRLKVFYPSILFIIIYYLFIFILSNRSLSKIVYRNRKIIGVSISLVILALLISNSGKSLYLGFFDVGQGDSSYIMYKDIYIQIDTGGSTYSSYNPGEEVTVKGIIKRGIDKIDILILSHFDEDHTGGTEMLLDKNLVKNIIINRKESGNETFESIINSKAKIYYPIENTPLIIDRDLKIEFFNVKPGEYKESNDSSLVVLITYKDKKILFTGDASYNIEDELAEYIGYIDLLKVSHHGSESSTSENFVYSIRPKYSIISVGKNNSYGHPSKKVLKNLNNVNSKILRTDLEGEIIFKIDDKISYKTYKNPQGFGTDMGLQIFSVIIFITTLIQIKKNEELDEIRRI